MTVPLTYSAHARSLLRLGLPLVATSVAGFAIHMTDTIMLGWYDVISLAAATVATSIWFVVFILGAGFSNAVVAMVAAAAAEGDLVRARRVTRMSMWLGLMFVVFAIAPLWWSQAFFRLLGQTDAVAAEAQRYLRIAGWGMIPALLANSMRSFLSGMQLTTVQIWVTLVALVVNAIINYALIFGRLGAPEMGIQGAAIASVLVQALTFTVLALYAQAKFPDVALFQRIWRPDWQAMGQVFRIGLPIGLTSLAEGGLFSASAVMMGWIGELELAAHGIALQITALFFMFHVGMSQAATVRAGGAFGRRDEAELRRWGKTAFAVSWGFGVLAVILMVTIPSQMVALFVDPDEPARAAIIRIGTTLVLLSALFQFVDATQIVSLSLLRGVQDTTVPMWLATVSYWLIGIPASYVMAFVWGWGGVGLWLGLTVGLAAASAGLMARFWGRSVRLHG